MTYAPRLAKDDGRIDWTGDAASIERMVRAFTPWPSAFTTLDGRTVKILAARIADPRRTDAAPGTIRLRGDELHVGTGRGVLAVTRLRPRARRPWRRRRSPPEPGSARRRASPRRPMDARTPAGPADALAARALALDVLMLVEETAAHADVALAAGARRFEPLAPRPCAHEPARLRHARLARPPRLAARASLDRDPATFHPHVRTVLRLGLHQIALLDRVPPHAAVATSVDLVKRHVRAASGLVNAVLRRAVRERAALPLPDPALDPTAHLAIALSHPRWLVERWQARFGTAAVGALLAADNEAAPTVLRARPGSARR